MHALQRSRRRSSQGFTIVELLIVIVVIGILAAITIVAFNGVSQRATVASMQSDLEGANKSLQIYQVTNSAFPVGIDCSATPATNTICIKPSGNTSYTTYLPNNSTNPPSYCLTATNGSTNYYVTDTNTARTSGACTVTNLAANPSIETGLANISTAGYGTGGAGSITQTSDGWIGTYAATQSWSTVATAGGASLYEGLSSGAPTLSVSPNTTYIASAYCKTNTSIAMEINTIESNGVTQTVLFGNTQTVAANQWTRLSYTFTTRPDTTLITFGCRIPNLAGTSAGLTMKMDGAMLTRGPTLYNYADGTSPGWSWTGAANASTSTGVPL